LAYARKRQVPFPELIVTNKINFRTAYKQANIQGGDKTVRVVFKYLTRSLLLNVEGAGGVTPPPLTTTQFLSLSVDI
jgi:hypothetical protein